MNTTILARINARFAGGNWLTSPPPKPEPSRTKLLGAALAAIILALVVLLVSGMAQAAGEGCNGVQVSPGDNLTQVAAARAPGTTYCIQDGDYPVTSNIVVEDGDTFSGVYSDSTRPTISTTTAEHIFHTSGADGVTIRGLDISGAVHNNICEPNCGRAIGGGGNNLLVEDVRAHHNENQGIGGTGNGLRVIGSELDHNGSHDAAADSSTRSAAGIKSINSMYVYNSYIHDNYWAGVWCDLECGTFEVHDSTITANGKVGIHDEISSGPALFEGNRIQGNGYSESYDGKLQGGIMITSSRHVRTHHNAFRNNSGPGVLVRQSPRPPQVQDVRIHDNVTYRDGIRGCDISGVTCTRND